MDYTYVTTACQGCERPILVEMGLIGVPHHTWVLATCAACIVLPISDTFMTQSPDAASAIAAWVEKQSGRGNG